MTAISTRFTVPSAIKSVHADRSATTSQLPSSADTVATRVAAQLKARRLFLVSNVPGVLRDKNDPSTRIPKLTAAEARAQIASGVIVGGMIPKVEESLDMLDEGIGAIHIVGLNPADAILREAREPGSAGTAFLRGNE